MVDSLTHDVEKAAEQLSECEDETIKADINEAMKYVEDARNSREVCVMFSVNSHFTVDGSNFAIKNDRLGKP